MSEKTRKRAPRLGRGLSSLMSAPPRDTPAVPVMPDDTNVAVAEADADSQVDSVERSTSAEASESSHDTGLQYLSVADLSPNPHQPRQRFDDRTIEQLAASIRSDGLMQPVVARPDPSKAGRYEIVAGERRWRAAKSAGLTKIPIIVRELDDRQSAEWSLIENLQREDLNPIDRAEAFKRLCERHSLSHEQVAQRMGLERSTISNLIRLLNLSDSVRDLVRQDLLSMGQARAIAGLENASAQEALASRAVREGLSVREVEKLARQLANGGASTAQTPSSGGGGKPAYLRDLEKQLAEQLGTKVQLATGRKKGHGKLTIEFYSLDQFDAIVSKLGVEVR